MKLFSLLLAVLLIYVSIFPLISAIGSRNGSRSSLSSRRTNSGFSSTRSRPSGTGSTGSRTVGSGSSGSNKPNVFNSKPIGTGSSALKPAGSGSTGLINSKPGSGLSKPKPIGLGGIGTGAAVGTAVGAGIGTGIGLGIGSGLNLPGQPHMPGSIGFPLGDQPRPGVFVGTRYNGHCVRNSDCPNARGFNGRCFGGSCSCHSWYIQTANGCESKGRECSFNTDCSTAVIPIGGSGLCENGYCTCMTGYVRTSDGCTAAIPGGAGLSGGASGPGIPAGSSLDKSKGRTCTSSFDCDSSVIPFGGSGQCLNGHCACMSGYRETALGCELVDTRFGAPSGVGRYGVSKRCTTSGDCPLSSAYTGACFNSECTCQPFHHFERQRCVKDASAAVSASLLVVMVTSIMAYATNL